MKLNENTCCTETAYRLIFPCRRELTQRQIERNNMKTKITDEIVEAAANIGQFGLGAVLVAADKIESEHAALVAVAEAGNDCREVLKMVSQNWREAGSMVDTMKRSAADFAEAQANLAAVREGGAK